MNRVINIKRVERHMDLPGSHNEKYGTQVIDMGPWKYVYSQQLKRTISIPFIHVDFGSLSEGNQESEYSIGFFLEPEGEYADKDLQRYISGKISPQGMLQSPLKSVSLRNRNDKDAPYEEIYVPDEDNYEAMIKFASGEIDLAKRSDMLTEKALDAIAKHRAELTKKAQGKTI